MSDGGPAFPELQGLDSGIDLNGNTTYTAISAGGMSLRDYFAAQAMAGMQARDYFDAGQATPEQRARLAYIEADAMLKARDRR